MENFHKIVCLLILVLLPLQSQAEKYRSEAYGFEVKFPGKVDKTSGRSKDGLIITYFASLAPSNLWGAHVSTAFADPREAANLGQWFRSFSRGMGQQGFFVASDHKQTTFQGRPAVRFNFSADGSSGSGYAIIDSDRYFTVVILSPDEKDRPSIESFIQTFKILER